MAPALAHLHTLLNCRLFLNTGKLAADARLVEALRVFALDFHQFSLRSYPRLYPLSLAIYEAEILPGDFVEGEEEDVAVLPPSLPLSRHYLAEDGAYLFNNGEHLIIILMPAAPAELLLELFGSEDLERIEAEPLPELETSHNVRVHNILNELRRRNEAVNAIYQPLVIRTPLRKGPFAELLGNMLKEDLPECNYHNFLDAVHRAVQAILK